MIQAWSCSELQAAGVTAVFGIALFLPGAFNNYLVDTFSRKNVCTRSIMLLALVGILYPYVSSVEMVVLLRILQGALFGIVLMATGSTLAIDVTPGTNIFPAKCIDQIIIKSSGKEQSDAEYSCYPCSL
jgi:MFS family permease